MTTTATAQRHQALTMANARRLALADTFAGLRSGTVTLRDLMADPPAHLEHSALIDVVRSSGGRRNAPGLARLGRMAIRDDVNLLMQVGRASRRSREWVGEHVVVHPRLWVGDEPPREPAALATRLPAVPFSVWLEARREPGESQRAFARRAMYSERSLGNLTRRKYVLSSTVTRVAGLFGATVDDIYLPVGDAA